MNMQIFDGLAVYEMKRDGPCVVFVHGAMDRAAGMIRSARCLPTWNTIRYDRRGYGRSSEDAAERGFDGQVQDLQVALPKRPCIIFGHSYGGVIAMALGSMKPPEVIAIVSYEAPRAWEPWWPQAPADDVDPGDAAEYFMRNLTGDDKWLSIPPRVREQYRRHGELMVQELRWQETRRYDASQIKVPLIVGVGSESNERAQRAARLTAAEASMGTLQKIEGLGHGAPQTHPKQIAELIKSALKSISL
jgi:pimeloyl-ACP methyl ester carboxylesterase